MLRVAFAMPLNHLRMELVAKRTDPVKVKMITNG